MIARNTAFCALAGITRYQAVSGRGILRYQAIFGGIWRILRNYPSLPALYVSVTVFIKNLLVRKFENNVFSTQDLSSV